MLYRDDDVSKFTDIGLITKIHSLFVKYNKIHTIAVEMDGLWENKVVWYWLMTASNLDVGLHGWTHKDYSILPAEDIELDIQKSISYWNYNIERGKYKPKELKVFYPPWNKTSSLLEEICGKHGLSVNNEVGGDTYNFHWWTFIRPTDFERLEKSLQNVRPNFQ